MSTMGFSHHPGALPFVTVRHAKWANRLVDMPVIRITGEHGCDMPRGMARVVSVKSYHGECPQHLLGVYKGAQLVAIELDNPLPCEDRHVIDNEWGMCANCGAKI